MTFFKQFNCLLAYCIVNYRWVFVCLFLLPCTILYDLYTFISKVIISATVEEKKTNHFEATKRIQEQVREWQETGQDMPMCTARPGWKMMTLREPQYKKSMFQVHVDLGEILEINLHKQVVKVEPLVTMGQLSKFLEPFNLTLPVLVELDDLTVSGLIMGQGIESSSHIYGYFENICLSYELVLADGRLVTCSKDEDPDLFYSIPMSYGTLGFLTAVELKLIPSKRYVKLHYEPVYSLSEVVQICAARSREVTKYQFVEGIMFSQDQGVIMTGNMVDVPAGVPVNTISRWYKPWFYEHVRQFLEKGGGEECIPLRDYVHRHTKALFWELEDIVPFGNNILFRWIFGWAMPPKISFLKLTQSQVIKELYNKHHVVQDLILPVDKLEESIKYFHKEVNIYPVWLCPVLIPNKPGLVQPHTNQSELYIDIGLYGTPKTDNYHYKETIKRIEQFTISNKGHQMQYGGTYCLEVDFRKMFDHSLYDRVRARLQCHKAFPNIYGKINRKVRD